MEKVEEGGGGRGGGGRGGGIGWEQMTTETILRVRERKRGKTAQKFKNNFLRLY